MNRLSLIKIWNRWFTVLVFLLPVWVAHSFEVAKDPYWPKLHLPSAIGGAVVAGLLWAICLNRIFLPGLAKGRVFLKSFGLMALEGYVGIALLAAMHHFWFYLGSMTVEKILLTAVTTPAFVLIWFSPLFILLVLLCAWLNGFVIRFLYERRDYLEGV